jgi:hypothetical protein
MDVGNAITRPFSNITTLVIGIILMIIPIINILTIPGYFMRVAKTAMAKKKELPKFDNFGGLIVDSIKAIVTLIIHYIVFAIVAIILSLIPYINGVLVAIWTIIFIFIVLSGFLTLAKTGDIGKAINVPELVKQAARANFIIAVIVAAIISIVIMAIIGAILMVGLGAAMLPTIMSMTMGGVSDPMALMSMIGALAGVGIIGAIIAVIVGYILEVFSVTLIAEEY